MKWDVKHDRAKRVIDAFLDNAEYWQEREDLAEGLTDEEKQLVNEEVALMIASIRKRYKLEEKLPEQPKTEPHLVPMPGIEKLAEYGAKVRAELQQEEKPAGEKPKRIRKKAEGTGEKKERKPRTRKVKEVTV